MLGFESRGLHWIITGLPKDLKVTLGILLFLLTKHHHLLTYYPERFLQRRKGVISPGIVSFAAQTSRNTIRRRCSQEGAAEGILAGFKCAFYVVCLAVSQKLDYMVCECTNDML